MVQGLKLEALGTTSVASALAYLDNGVVYVGSSSGDSQLVRLHENKDSQGAGATRSAGADAGRPPVRRT